MSASPAAQDGEQQPQEEASKKIQFQFCRECSNLLYPKEDKASHELLFECRTCRWHREAESTCVYRNELSNTVGETAGITQDVASDPTVGAHTAASGSSATHASSSIDSGNGDTAASFVPSPPMSPLPDFCTMCGQEIFCEKCGNPTDFGFFLEVEDNDMTMTDAASTGAGGSNISAAHLSIDEDYDDYDDLDESPEPSAHAYQSTNPT